MTRTTASCLVDTLEGWDGLALVLVERRPDHVSVPDVDVRRVGVVLEGQGVLHPFVVVTLYKSQI